MKRNIEKFLADWKISKRRKPLILKGARQVGKTYALKSFGLNHYKNTVYLNFEKDAKLKTYFNETLDANKLIKILSIHTEKNIEPGHTLLIFDEIQECPKALNSLKYFCEEAAEYHVVAAGSLLGVKVADQGFPVGKVSFYNLYPLTFYEFLSALNQDKTRNFLEEYNGFDPFPLSLHEKILSILKTYYYVGGMPEVVADYVKNENLKTVREIQREILISYENDFAKHAPANEVMKLITVWHQIHKQLAKENKKFIFASIRKSARGRDYEDAIQWLADAGLIHKCFLIKTPKFPLSSYSDNNIFKIFLFDTGLLCAQSNLSPNILIDGNELFTEFKGSLTENYVTQELIATRHYESYYWSSEGTAEIDFLLEGKENIFPLEIKSGGSDKNKSLGVYRKKFEPPMLFRANTLNLKNDVDIYNFPLYYISKIPQLLVN